MGQKNSKLNQGIPKKGIVLQSRKDECRSLLRNGFQNNLFSLVPLEIWRDLIVSSADPRSVVALSQTCWAFKEIFDHVGENNFNLALLLRKEDQIRLAKRYLLKCAENNNAIAMLHVGYALMNGGWGLNINDKKGAEWFRKAGELGNGHGMVFYARCLKQRIGIENDDKLSSYWSEKALSSNFFAIGYCHFFGLGVEKHMKLASDFLEKSAREGDEFSQYMFGEWLSKSGNFERAFYWYLKSADQGLYNSQMIVAEMYLDWRYNNRNKKRSEMYYKKAHAQNSKI